MIKQLCGWVENGATQKDATALENIAEETFYRWKKRGEEDIKKGESTIYSQFCESLKRARVAFKQYHREQILKAAKKQWQASAWMLERQFPEEYGRKQQIEHSGDGLNITIKYE